MKVSIQRLRKAIGSMLTVYEVTHRWSGYQEGTSLDGINSFSNPASFDGIDGY